MRLEVKELNSEKDALKAELQEAMQQNPAKAEDFDERIKAINDAFEFAKSEFNSAAAVAVDQINNEQPITETVLLLIGKGLYQNFY